MGWGSDTGQVGLGDRGGVTGNAGRLNKRQAKHTLPGVSPLDSSRIGDGDHPRSDRPSPVDHLRRLE